MVEGYNKLMDNAKELPRDEVIKLASDLTEENKEKIINSFLKVIPHMMKRYAIRTASASLEETLREEMLGECILSLINAVNNFPTERGPEAIYGYVYTSIENQIRRFITKTHRQKRKHMLEAINLEDYSLENSNGDFEENRYIDLVEDESIDFDYELTKAILEDYIISLEDEVDKKILQGVWLDELQLKEVGEKLGITPVAVYWRLSKQREKIKHILGL